MGIWKKKIDNSVVAFNSKELLLEFKEEVQVQSLRRGYQDNAEKILFGPMGDPPSKKIEMHFVGIVPPDDDDLMLWIDSKTNPCFTKVVWANKDHNQSVEYTQNQLNGFNVGSC